MPPDGNAVTRRRVLGITGSAAAVAGGVALLGTVGAQEGGWGVVDTPTSEPLHDVVHTGNGPYAVGEGGLLLDRTNDGWEVAIGDGPGGENNTLYAAAGTGEGGRLWVAGASGALGAYDVESGRTYNHGQPGEIEDDLGAITVDGGRGGEELVVGSDAGQTVAGSEQDGDFAWDEVIRPTDGSPVTGLEVDPEHPLDSQPAVLGADEGGNAFRLHEFGDSSETIGIDGVEGTFRDVEPLDDWLFVASDAGTVYKYDTEVSEWTGIDVSDQGVHALAGSPFERRLLGVGDDGNIHEREDDNEWTTFETDTSAELRGAAYLDHPIGTLVAPVDVAVGDDGVILERDAEF